MRLKLAILDLYNNTPNQGMRCIKDIVNRYATVMDWELFDVRAKCELPDTSFDVYISSGGPGSPLDGDGIWDKKYYALLDDLYAWNAEGGYPKKHVIFICHSFQMACNHFKLGSVLPRRSMSFGTFPVHKTDVGARESVFEGLDDPFYVADFRRWQVIEPKMDRFAAMGAEILALEKIRPYVPLERAIMAVRFSNEMIGVQFHPEADPDGMIEHFKDPELKADIIRKHGEEKYYSMMRDLHHSDRITQTHDAVIPNFLDAAVRQLQEEKGSVEILMQ